MEFYSENVDDQWAIGPLGGHIGIRNEAIESAMNMRGIEQDERGQLLKEVKIISRAIASELAEEREREREANA